MSSCKLKRIGQIGKVGTSIGITWDHQAYHQGHIHEVLEPLGRKEGRTEVGQGQVQIRPKVR